MARFLLQVALPLFAPLAVYMAWLWYAQKRAEKYGDEPPAFTKGSAFIAIVVGAVLAIISLIGLAFTGSHDIENGSYVAPRFEDGKVIGPSYDGEAPEDTGSRYRSE